MNKIFSSVIVIPYFSSQRGTQVVGVWRNLSQCRSYASYLVQLGFVVGEQHFSSTKSVESFVSCNRLFRRIFHNALRGRTRMGH